MDKVVIFSCNLKRTDDKSLLLYLKLGGGGGAEDSHQRCEFVGGGGLGRPSPENFEI